MRTLRTLICVLPIAAGISGPARALETAEEILECVRRNVPQRSIRQEVEFTSTDRIGGSRETRARILGKRMQEGERRVVLRFSRPLEIRDSALLIVEREPTADVFLYLPELRNTKRVSARGAASSLLGTDFSAEDFERLQGFDRPARHTRLEDAELAGRRAYVVETKPAADAESSYERIVTWIDRESCVPLQTESYERGSKLRKVLTVNPAELTQEGEIWIARDLTMRDVRDETSTHLLIESIDIDIDIGDREFEPSQLPRKR